ncbi:hypothetical protein FQN54_004493 [Arachnomyces sp. PD_36]|nr:hypothetical protein FQN54_004493 [Arachnomyces sp. PD_36]
MSLQPNGDGQAKVVVGVDFGMTSSAAAWAVTTNKRWVHFIFKWPEQPLKESAGVPTAISYMTSPETTAWGFRGAKVLPRYQWFKASLEAKEGEDVAPEAFLVNGRDIQDLGGGPATSNALVVDYLRGFREYVERHIVERNSRLAQVPVEYVLALPLGWLDASRSRALKCAQDAGMTLHLPEPMLEPEAAATYLFSQGQNPTKGSTYILCDAGGRTVDLISFIYTGRKNSILAPVTTGCGGNCGSTTLNMRFRDFLVATLRHSPGWSDEALQSAMDDFEWVTKRGFSGDDNELFKIPVTGMANSVTLGISEHELHIYGIELRAIIGPVVEDVVTLVKQQIERTGAEIAGLILVGGFADSPFLRNSITKRIPQCIPVLKPQDVGIAVAAGSVKMALGRA